MLRGDLDSSAAGSLRPASANQSEVHLDVDASGPLALPSAHLIFQGTYRKIGLDLVVSDDEYRVVVHDYFRADKRPRLVSPDGASLSDAVVASLAISKGEVYAQATPPAAAAAIGRVETVSGTATAIRNGVPVILNGGDPVYRGDTVQTDRGSSLGITFVDGSTFSLAASARMVLNELVYNPGGTGNAAVISLVQGSITFLAGQVAKTGDMRVSTPVATMGIRGTLVGAEIDANDGTTKFSVKLEQNGQTGSFELIRDGRVIAVISRSGEVTTVTPAGTLSTQPLTVVEQQAEQLAVAQLYQIAAVAAANPFNPSLPGATAPGAPTGPQGGGGSGSSSPPQNAPGNGTSTPPTDTPPLVQAPSPTAITIVVTVPAQQPAAVVTDPAVPRITQPAGERLISVASATGAIQPVPSSGDAVTIAGTYGILTVLAGGAASYAPVYAQPLAEGQTGQDAFTFEYRDPSSGVTRTETRSYEVTGVNDVPTVTGPLAVAGNEGGAGITADLLLGAADPDAGETAGLSITSARFAVDGGPSSATAPVGVTLSGSTLVVDPGNAAFNGLALGQTETITVTYRIVDVHGAFVDQTATVVVTGTNDAPSILGGVDSTGASATGNGTIATAQDLDGTFSVRPDGNVTDSGSIPHTTLNVTGENQYEWFKITVTQAGSRLIVDVDDPYSFDSWVRLYDSQGNLVLVGTDDGGTDPGSTDPSRYDTFLDTIITVPGVYYLQLSEYVQDPIPAGLSTTLHVSLENAVLGSAAGGDVLEAGAAGPGRPSTSGVLAWTDPDSDADGTNDTWSLVAAASQTADAADRVTGTYGTFAIDQNGAWTYTLANDDPDTQRLAAGETRTEVFTARLTDAHGVFDQHEVTVTVVGANDAPVITQTSGSTSDTPIQVAENTSDAFLTVTASDVENQALTFSIGANPDRSFDNELFSIDSQTGAVRFLSPPDYEANGSGSDGLYKLQVTVTDTQGGTARRDYFVQVTDMKEGVIGFDAVDYLFGQNEFSFFNVGPKSPSELADIEQVGSYGDTGWQHHTFTAAASGDTTFGLGVVDTGDGSVSSALYVDNVKVGGLLLV